MKLGNITNAKSLVVTHKLGEFRIKSTVASVSIAFLMPLFREGNVGIFGVNGILLACNGVENNVFYPEQAGLGTHSITYVYIDGNGYMNYANLPVKAADFNLMAK